LYICDTIKENMQNDEALRLRISAEMKADLQKMADNANRKLSDYIRLELAQLIDQAKLKERLEKKK
jgi:hypothetical protein